MKCIFNLIYFVLVLTMNSIVNSPSSLVIPYFSAGGMKDKFDPYSFHALTFQVLYFMIGFFVQSGGIGPSFGQGGGVGELP